MADHLLVLAHGAGQPSGSDWMESLAAALSRYGVRTVRFDFEYMKRALEAGKPRPPSRLEVLVQEYGAFLDELGGRAFIGGKSLGGRVASHLALEKEVAGWIAFGYPFHPPGKPDKLRTEHLPRLSCPALICQGERDPFGRRSEVESYGLPARIGFQWLKDGDHQFKPPAKSPATLQQNMDLAARAAAEFMRRVATEDPRLPTPRF